jgi:hypothetical protein
VRRLPLIALAIAAGSLAACGGGSHSIPSLTNTTGSPASSAPSTQSTQKSTASVKITIPAKTATTASTIRTPQYISASTQSMVFSSLDSTGKATQLAEFDLTSTSPGCAAVTGGGTQCTETLGAPSGQDTFQVTAYDTVGGKGNALSTATLTATLTAGSNNTIPLVMDGVAATAQVVVGTGSLPVGTAGSTIVTVQAKDAQGNTIVGPGGFTNPFTLAIANDTYGTLKLSQATISKPGDTATLSYNGLSLVGATINATASNVTTTPATVAGSGYAINVVGINNQFATQSCPSNYLYPGSIAAVAGGGAAFDYYASWSQYSGCGTGGSDYWHGVGVLAATGQVTLYRGDTVDPLASPAPLTTSPPTPAPGTSPAEPVTIIHGMSANIVDEPGDGYSSIAAGGAGNPNVYYTAQFSHLTANNDTEYYGVIGALNPSTLTVKETVVKGEPYQVRVASDGSVWFTENSGRICLTAGNCVPSLSGDGSTYEYGIGKLNADGSVAFEKPFSQLGLPINSTYPADFTISPDGTELYLANWQNSPAVIAIPISGGTLGTPTSANLTIASSIYAIAASNDTAFWTTDYESGSYYYFGSAPKATFGPSAIKEFTFTPSRYMYSYSAVYADGSFWAADDDYAGVGRFPDASPATGQEYIQTDVQPNANNLYNCGISAGGGAIYVSECDYGSIYRIVYGAPQATLSTQSASVSTQSVRRTGSTGMTSLPTHARPNHTRVRQAGAWTRRTQ